MQESQPSRIYQHDVLVLIRLSIYRFMVKGPLISPPRVSSGVCRHSVRYHAILRTFPFAEYSGRGEVDEELRLDKGDLR